MPTPEEILTSTAYLANKYMAIAVMWHVVIVLLLTAYISQKQMSSRIYYGLPGLLFLSVALLAFSVLNFFNALVYFGLSVLLLRKSITTGDSRFELNKSITLTISAYAIILSGLVYPHFLDSDIFAYIVASPTGVIPCPTLLLVSGTSLLFVRPDDKSIFYILIPVNVVYGLIGIFVLGVYLDIILLGTAILQSVYIIFNHKTLKVSKI
jgi:hypothetical protein